MPSAFDLSGGLAMGENLMFDVQIPRWNEDEA